MGLDWLEIAKELKTISQAGKFFAKDVYEKERHERLEEIAAEILADHSELDADKIKSALGL